MKQQKDELQHSPAWSPLSPGDLERVLAQRDYTTLHLYLLYWLIWLPLLSTEELLRVLSTERQERLRVTTKRDLSQQLKEMLHLRLIDSITLREPHTERHERYYVTDLGLHLYRSVVRLTPSLTIGRLVSSYPVAFDDLIARLARPQVHLALADLATQLIAEGTLLDYRLVSYQQPWHHAVVVFGQKQLFRCDAALLIERPTGTTHAFFVQIDVDSPASTKRGQEHFLLRLLDWRRESMLLRQSWPGLLLVTRQEHLASWSSLLLEVSQTHFTRPLAGGMTTITQLPAGISRPIWWDLTALPSLDHPLKGPRVSFEHLLKEPASPELVEHFSRQLRFQQLLLADAHMPALPPKRRLLHAVGEPLRAEAAQLDADRTELLLAGTRKDRASVSAAGLLTLVLSPLQKTMLFWMARHPLLDLPTLQALLRSGADELTLSRTQRALAHLFKLRLVETVRWSKGSTRPERQRYVLSATALRYVAIRRGEPFSAYLMLPKYRKREDTIWRQWATPGLFAQMHHTNGLYTCIRAMLSGTRHEEGPMILDWKSAHEAAREYEEPFHPEKGRQKIRPDAELVIAATPHDEGMTILLEYDRATTDASQYARKFQAYLDYHLATRLPLPPIVVITPHLKAVNTIRRVLSELGGPSSVMMVLEQDVLMEGLAAILIALAPCITMGLFTASARMSNAPATTRVNSW